MSVGEQMHRAFRLMLKRMGGPIQIYKNYGQPNQSHVTIPLATQAVDKATRDFVFHIPDKIDVQLGDVIQQTGSSDLWVVKDVQDYVVAGTWIRRNVTAGRADTTGVSRVDAGSGHTIHIGGSVHGGLQVGNVNSTQNIGITTNVKLTDTMTKLRQSIEQSDLDDMDKEEAADNLDRVEQLSLRLPDEKAKLKIHEKLAAVVSTITISEKLALIAMPYIQALGEMFK